MSDAIAQWLEQLSLGQYAGAFEESAIGLEHLPDLDHDILKEIGVRAVGHRITILKAAANSAGPAASAAPPSLAESSPRPAQVSRSEAERRQLSVMFCDLVGSTALSERLDLEVYRELLGAYQDAARDAIDRYDGYIARYMGDGLLVYFGYPTAHEDDAERAVRAGLDVVEAVSALSVPGDVVLRVRVGIATGQVVAGDIVGEGASEERAVLGETPNLAARLQGIAAPNSVVIAEATERLVEGRFEFKPLEPQPVKGLRKPVRAFQAKGIRATSRFEAATARGLSAFVGRASEVQRIVDEEGLGDFAQHVLVNNWRGRAHTRMGDYETGYRLTKLATTRWREAEGKICSALFWGGEAIALGGLGRTREALELIDAAIAHCRDTGDRYMEPEVLRVKAELMLTADGSDTDAAEAILLEALQIARDHRAKSWELRAATSLAKLIRAQDGRSKARSLLAPIYDWFTEGFDTTDLREAKALLQELT